MKISHFLWVWLKSGFVWFFSYISVFMILSIICNNFMSFGKFQSYKAWYKYMTWVLEVYIYLQTKIKFNIFLHGLNFIADPWLLNIAARKESVRHQGHHLVTRPVYPDQVNYRCSLRVPMAGLTLVLLTLGTVAATDILIGRYNVITLYVPFR